MITPIHKGESKSVAANYRPVALTSHLIKIFEKILRKNISEHMEKNDLFNKSQHGFRAGRSCLSQLLEQYDLILSMLDNNSNVDVVYLDFSKAFDKVDHKIVLNKINNLGIEGKVHSWLKSFLTGRKQSVMVNGIMSEFKEVKSGVPQGSVLGPLIFLILIGDIDEEIAYSVLNSFADDTRIAKEIKNINDTKFLQSDLDKVYKWSSKNNMVLNDIKFESLKYGRDESLKSTIYKTPNDLPIETKSNLKDLGVVMSIDCIFKQQISSMIQKAKNQISWILRAFKTRERRALLILYKSLVIPILEYCSVLWSPSTVGLIQSLEAIQWSFIRKVRHNYCDDYWECLKKMKIYSLQRRRERYRIIYIWKILEGMVPNPNKKVVSSYNARRGRLCVVQNLMNTGTLSTIYDASLAVQGVKLFNSMPMQVRNMTNVPVEKFKKVLDHHLATVPDEPQICGYTASRRADTNSLLDMQKYAESVAGPIVFQDHHIRRGEQYNLQA